MITTKQDIAIAKVANAAFIERQRRVHLETPGVTFTEEGEPEPDSTAEACLRAREWCEAKRQNVRPLREQDISNPSVREGRESALDWLKRKSKSAIKK